MKIYKFNISETNYIEFTEEEMNNFKNVDFTDDNTKGKLIHIKRNDGKTFILLAPLDMFEISEVLDE